MALEPFPFEAVKMMSAVAHGYEGTSGLKGNGLYYPVEQKVDREGVFTIGRGHVVTDEDRKNGVILGGKKVLLQDGITLDQVDLLFERDVKNRIDSCNRAIQGKGKAHQKACMLDLEFNCPSALNPTSNALKNYLKGDMLAAAAVIMQYNKVIHRHPRTKKIIKIEYPRGLFYRRGTDALLLVKGIIHIAKDDHARATLEKLLKEAGIVFTKPKFT